VLTAWLITGATAVAVGLLLAAERSGSPWRGWAKAAASSGFIALALVRGATDSGYGRWVLAALCLGWVGDVALVSSQRTWFLAGLGAFLLSHLTYVAAFAAVGPSWVTAALAGAALTVPAVAVVRWLWPRLPAEMKPPVLAYVGVISAMVAAAVGAARGRGTVIVVPAAVAFYLSDLAVARDRFVAPSFVNRLWGLPLYYAAQVAFAFSVA
jgi:uncharacterized membrane protein YhhN